MPQRTHEGCISIPKDYHFLRRFAMKKWAYYNECDPYAAQWIRNLINAGHVAPGVVDERSIEDVCPIDVADFVQCHWFAGIAVWSYALRLAGWPDDRPVWTGSCPCQPFSAAGKGHGFADERHLWPAWFHLIRECRPGVVFGEQVASRDGLGWLDLVQADLEGADYASGAVDICAAGVGAFIRRPRIFIVADTNGYAFSPEQNQPSRAWQQAPRWNHVGGCRAIALSAFKIAIGADSKCRPCEPGTQPMADGAPEGMAQLRAYGNAINAEAAAAVIRAYIEAREAARIAA
jgi:DNA (cytosine-5)-methyltransferase 1